jgi:tRNA threonylcarbamoyladenosine biosynthesis protein TsaE
MSIVGSTPAQPLQLLWPDEAATQAFAVALARQPALAQAFVTLHGDLGAGKTTLVRHLLQALGVAGRIKSPTYAIVESYDTAAFPIWHFDFYRFNDPQEWEDAGFRDIFASPGLKLVEWPHKAEGLLPQADLDLALQTAGETARRVSLRSHTPLGAALLQALASQTTPAAAGPHA